MCCSMWVEYSSFTHTAGNVRYDVRFSSLCNLAKDCWCRDVINITFVRIRSPVKTEFILGLILRPCLHITFFSPFLSAAPLIYLTYFNVMCEQHHRNSFNHFKMMGKRATNLTCEPGFKVVNL